MINHDKRQFIKGIFLAGFFAGAGVLLLGVAWNWTFTSNFSDSAIYLLLAPAVLDPANNTDLLDYLLDTWPFPPMFPWVIGMMGGGAHAVLQSHIIVVLFALAAGLVFLLLSRSIVHSSMASLLLLVLFFLLPGNLLQIRQISTETLYLLISLLILWIRQKSGASPLSLWWLALILGILMLIRTVGLALLVALCVIEWKDKNYKNIGILSLSLLLPVAWWVLKNIQGYQSGYLKSLWWKIFPSPPEYLQTTIGENLVAFWQAWVSLFDLYGSQSSSFVLAPMLFLAAVVCVIRVGRGRADAVYVLLYLSVICFWPHEAHMQRFLYPIAPLLLIFFLFGIQPLVKSVSSGLRVVLTMAFMTAILIVSLPSGVQLAQRLYNPPSDPAFARSEFWINARPISEVKKQLIFQSALFDSMQELGYLVPEGDCIYALEPALVMFHSKRITKAMPLRAADGNFTANTAAHCQWIFMMAASRQPGGSLPPLYPVKYIEESHLLARSYYADFDPEIAGPEIVSMLARIRTN